MKYIKLFWIEMVLVIIFWGMLLVMMFYDVTTCHAAMLGTMNSVSTTTVGQVFTVDVYAVPQGKEDASYMVGMQLEYHDAKLLSWESNKEFLKVRTDKLWNNYDWYISRTFGFPGGFSKTKKLGTATFQATKEGKVDVGILDGFVLNAKGENTFNY